MAICNAFRAFALTTDFREFKMVTVDEFNHWYSDGNPLVAEGDVYFKEFGRHTVTVNECDGLWVCEVTDNIRCETGICEGFGGTPEEAWEATKKAIEDEPERPLSTLATVPYEYS